MRYPMLLKGRALALLLAMPLVAFGGYNTKSGGYNSDLYPPQAGLVQWLQFDADTNMTVVVGTAATNSGYTVGQTNWQASLPAITVSGTGTDTDGTHYYDAAASTNSNPVYILSGEGATTYNTTDWLVWDYTSNSFWTNTADTTFPPAGNYVGASSTAVVSYASPWVDSGEFATLTESDLQTWNGLTNAPIKNIYTYSDAPPTYMSTVSTISPYSGVYTNTTP